MIKRLLKSMVPSQILWRPRYYTFYRRLKRRDKGLLILDAGCGEGIVTRGLLKRGFRVIGADRSFEAVRTASAENRKGAFLVCDLANLPFKDSALDIIFSLDVLEYIKDAGRVFCEFNRVLKEDGRLGFSIPDGYVCSAKLFTSQRILRRIVPSFLKTHDMPGNRAWLDFASEEMARKLGSAENYSPDTLIKESEKFFSVSDRQYFIQIFTSLVTDITYGIKWAYYLRFPLFFIAVRLDHYIFKIDRGYGLFYEMKKHSAKIPVIINRKKSVFRVREVWFADTPYEIEGCDIALFIAARNRADVEGFSRKEAYTWSIDLTHDLDDIHKGMSDTCKNEINRATKDGVEVKAGEGFEDFFRINHSFRKAKGLPGLNKTAESIMRLSGKLFVARLDGEVVAGQLYIESEGVMRLLVSVSKRLEVEHSKASVISRASRLITWEAIKYAKNKGIKEFDFGGYYTGEDKNDEREGINFFKRSFGGKLALRYNYQKDYSMLYGAAKKIYHLVKGGDA